MKYYIIFLLFLVSSSGSFSFAQSPQFMLTGIIQVNSGETFPYVIVFTENNGIIKGYSLTYKAPDETKTAITGTLDRQNHILKFKETEIMYSHGYHTKAFMCLVDATLEYTSSNIGSSLSGPIKNTEADKTACTGGKIIFNDYDELQKLFSRQEKFDTVISMKKKVVAPAPVTIHSETKAISTPTVTDKITANIEKTYDWHSDTVVLDIWDGDKITVLYNGKALLTHYLLVKEKKQLHIPLSGTSINTLTIIAENEGLEPPNTASLMLTDDQIRYSVLAYNNKGQQAVIKIKKVR